MNTDNQREAVRYIKRIRNANKREYATAYLEKLVGLRDSEPAHACSFMAAQAVRLNLTTILNS